MQQVDIKYLEKAITKHAQGARLRNISAINSVAPGWLSNITRLILEWEVTDERLLADLPTSVILKTVTHESTVALKQMFEKTLTDDGITRLKEALINFNNNECIFYNFVESIHQNNPFQGVVVRSYHQQLYGNGRDGMLILEDLEFRAKAGQSSRQSLTMQQLCSIVEFYAKLHAFCWKNAALWKAAGFQSSAFVWKNFVLTHESAVLDIYKHLQHDFRSVKEADLVKLNALQRLFATEAEQQDNWVLVHGDCWSNNIFFPFDSSRRAFQGDKVVAILDWQYVHQGGCMEDLSHLMVSSCSVSMRRAHELGVLQFYYDALLAAFDHQPSKLPYTFEQLVSLYRQYLSFAAYFYLVKVAAELQRMRTPRDKKVKQQLIDRCETVIHEALAVQQGAPMPEAGIR